MANLRDIKKRIKSVKKTQKLTSAMKMVAAARLRRIEPRLEGARQYRATLTDSLSRVFLEYPLAPGRFPLVQERQGGVTGLVVVSGERGLCGAYNASVINSAARFIRERGSVHIVAMGKKGAGYFEKHGIDMEYVEQEVLDNLLYKDIEQSLSVILDSYLSGEVSEWHIVYHEFVSMMTQTLRVERLLPMQLPESKAKTALDFLSEPDVEPLLERMIPQLLRAKFYEAILESVASEQGARRNAMESASDNALDMIERLTLLYNRKRQAAITTEILEVVAGAES